jgi:hypothetical protein
MGNKNNQLLSKINTSQYILLGLTAVSFVLAGLFFSGDFLKTYDASGHVAAAKAIRELFWPAISGWNPRELLGWPQGVFYPSLFHWLAATLSFVINLDLAVKILIALSLLALPISLFVFARSLTKSEFWSLLITIILFALLLIFPNFLGTGVRSLFQIGLLSNFFVLPFLFLFLASLNWQKPYLSAILLSTTILIHLVAGAVAAFYLVTLISTRLLIEKDKKFLNYLKIILVTLLLTSFFWVPMVVSLSYTSVSRHVSSYFLPNVFLFLASATILIFAYRRKERNILVLGIVASIFSALNSVDAFLIGKYGTSVVLYPFHLYRFQPYSYLFFSAAILLIIEKSKLGLLVVKIKSAKPAALLFVFAFIVGYLVLKNPAKLPQASFKVDQPSVVSGRFLETFKRSDIDPFWYGPQTTIEEGNSYSNWAYGLFTDSSPNAPYVESLKISMAEEKVKEEPFIETKTVDKQRINTLLGLFGVNYLVGLNSNPFYSIGSVQINGKTEFLNAGIVSENSPVEIIHIPLRAINKDWNREVENWWLEKGDVKDLPYFAQSKKLNLPSADKLASAWIVSENINKTGTKIDLQIDSKEKVPVLIKISYFPYWKAYENGKEIPIYRAAPNLMLISAIGKVSLEYKEPVWTKLLYLVSAVTLLAIIFFIFRRHRLTNFL